MLINSKNYLILQFMMLSNLFNYIAAFFSQQQVINNENNVNNQLIRRRRLNMNNIIHDDNNLIDDERNNNNIIVEEELILQKEDLKYLPTSRGNDYLVVQLPEKILQTGRGLYRMYKLSKIDKLVGDDNTIDRAYWECAGIDCKSKGFSYRRIDDQKDFHFQMKGNHIASCNITKEFIAEQDIRCEIIKRSRKVGVKQSSLLRNIQDELLSHIDNNDDQPLLKKQNITILGQAYSPNTINNVKLSQYSIKAASSRVAVKDRDPSPNLDLILILKYYKNKIY